WYPWFFQFVRCEALAHGGQLVESLALARQAYETSLAEGSTEAQAFFALHPARVVADIGNVRSGGRAAREAAMLFRQLGRPVFERRALVPLALAPPRPGHG